jgi:ADP-ribose pyrophosphatase YjhB (NUDIX family)
VLIGGEDYGRLDAHHPSSNGEVQLLSVAIAVVVHDQDVLLVCRRDNSEGIRWGFPTEIIKPGRDPAHVAVTETLAETGVHCAVRSALGTRLHPKTCALCASFLCDHLAGTPDNRDPVENLAAMWAPTARLADFVALDALYPPILDALGAASVC